MQKYKFDLDTIKAIAKQMIVLVDTREKQNQHILDYFAKHHIAYRKEKLDFGDYSFLLPAAATGIGNLYFHRDIVIERKASLEELSGNLAQERERFERELAKAKTEGCRIYLLVEDARGYQGILGAQYRTGLKPAAYFASLTTFQERYNVHINFCDTPSSAYLIYQTFYYYMREKLR